MSLLEKASKHMTKGIYAIKTGDTLELVNMPMSTTQIKAHRRMAKRNGVKVYAKY